MIVPGNHDVNRDAIDIAQEKWLSDLNDADLLNQQIIKNSLLWQRLLERQKAWQNFYKDLMPTQWDFDDLLNLTIGEMNFQGISIGIAGINSAWSCSARDAQGKIWIGSHQYQKAVSKIKECDFRIGVWHHPLSWLHPAEVQTYRQNIPHDFNLFLHGHEHSQFVQQSKNHLDVASGACYQGSKFKNAYCWISIDFDQGDTEVTLRTYSDEGRRGWIPFIIPGITDNLPGSAVYKTLFPKIKKSSPNPATNATLPLEADEVSNNSPTHQKQINSFSDLCVHIKPFLDENGTFFNAFGPNSSADAQGDVRLDFALWDTAKTTVIVPNNRAIANLMKDFSRFIPSKYEDCVSRMTAHIFAFEEHCKNPKISYKDYLFPQCFPEMVSVGLASVTDASLLTAIIDHLSIELKNEAHLKEAYIFGSALIGVSNATDVDIAVIHDLKEMDKILLFGLKVRVIEDDFYNNFGKHLHSTIFSATEGQDLSGFMRVAGENRRIL